MAPRSSVAGNEKLTQQQLPSKSGIQFRGSLLRFLRRVLNVKTLVFQLPLNDSSITLLNLLLVFGRDIVRVSSKAVARVGRVELTKDPVFTLQEALTGSETLFDALLLFVAFRFQGAFDEGLLWTPA
jgi:hypothetical protein